MDFTTLAQQCAPTVHVQALHALVKTESGFNPYAIGVVGRALPKQPQSAAEARAAMAELDRRGANYSVGYAQINRYNFEKYGLTRETVLDACSNLRAGSQILTACYQSASKQFPDPQRRLRAAYSCYYSGNFQRGFQPDGGRGSTYVERVLGHALGQPDPPQPALAAAAPLRPAQPGRGLGAGWMAQP